MRTTLQLVGAATVALLGATISQAPDDVEWLDDLQAARTRAAREGRPLLVVFR